MPPRRLLVLATAAFLVNCGGASTPRTAVTSAGSQVPIGDGSLGIPNGASKAQVLRKIGRPTRKAGWQQGGACWIYRVHAGMVSGIVVGTDYTAVKLCFLTGSSSVAEILDYAPHLHQPRVIGHWLLPNVPA